MSRACNTEWTSVCGSLTSATRQCTSVSHHLSTPHDFASFAVLLVVKFRDTNCVLAPRRAPAKKRPGNGTTPTKLTPRTHAHAWIRAGAEAGKGRVLSARAHVCDLLSLAVFFSARGGTVRAQESAHTACEWPNNTRTYPRKRRAVSRCPPHAQADAIAAKDPRFRTARCGTSSAGGCRRHSQPPSPCLPWRMWWADH